MLKEKKLSLISTCACLALVIILMVLQFLPYWTFVGPKCGEQTLSIADYVWFPNGEVQNEFEEYVKIEVYPGQGLTDHKVVNEIVMFPAFAFAFCVAAFILTLLKRKSNFTPAVVTIVAGIASVVSYILNPTLALSGNWIIHLIISGIVLAAAIAILVMNILAKKRTAEAGVIAQ